MKLASPESQVPPEWQAAIEDELRRLREALAVAAARIRTLESEVEYLRECLKST